MRILFLTLMMSFLSHSAFGAAKRQRIEGGGVDRLSSCKALSVIGGFLDNSDLDTFRQCASFLYKGYLDGELSGKRKDLLLMTHFHYSLKNHLLLDIPIIPHIYYFLL